MEAERELRGPARVVLAVGVSIALAAGVLALFSQDFGSALAQFFSSRFRIAIFWGTISRTPFHS